MCSNSNDFSKSPNNRKPPLNRTFAPFLLVLLINMSSSTQIHYPKIGNALFRDIEEKKGSHNMEAFESAGTGIEVYKSALLITNDLENMGMTTDEIIGMIEIQFGQDFPIVPRRISSDMKHEIMLAE